MKLFYTEKEMQKEIDRRLYEEAERFTNSRRFEQIEHEQHDLRMAVEELNARIYAMQGNTHCSNGEVPVCQH